MELPRRCPSAQPADGDDDGRRFPDSTPPNAREPSPAPAQGDAVVAALARRREELLWELHKAKIRREMLMCELVETERAIAARYAAARQPPTPITPPLPWPQGDLLPAAPAAREYAWRGAPWEEQAHAALAARSGDQEHPWWRWSPSALRTPVYPHVERSSSPPMARGGLADDDQRQERGGPSGSPAMVPPVQPAPNVEHSTPLLGKEPAVVVAAEAVVQTVANADTDQAFFGQGVTPGGRGVIGQQSKQGEIAVNGDAMLLLGQSTVSKSSEQPKPTESITGGQTDEHVQQRSQDRPAGQEIAEFEEQKRVDSNDEICSGTAYTRKEIFWCEEAADCTNLTGKEAEVPEELQLLPLQGQHDLTPGAG
ncbi:hypothetical protein E2562_008288 [Oryza meyeriana var. granulata]|uniref:Uncharacterized protein n=1 Tax=Oryza meyeriana var. granulata TaxID=110450 RepID=A0A6G1DFZ0_9ORYZ|nr:hypothetical protein E2562_008288 [Oryza meyeriana var. granulata]